MQLSRFLVPALMLAVFPVANMIASASMASGGASRVAQAAPAAPAAEPAQFAFGPPGGPRPLPPGRMGAMPPFPFGGFGEGGPASPRALCEARIHMEAGIRAFIRSRLRLDPAQREAWARMEAIVEPLDQRARDICATLPIEIEGPPAAPDRLAFAEQQLSLRVEMMRALQGPFREFHQTLSPAQRAALDRPPGPMMR